MGRSRTSADTSKRAKKAEEESGRRRQRRRRTVAVLERDKDWRRPAYSRTDNAQSRSLVWPYLLLIIYQHFSFVFRCHLPLPRNQIERWRPVGRRLDSVGRRAVVWSLLAGLTIAFGPSPIRCFPVAVCFETFDQRWTHYLTQRDRMKHELIGQWRQLSDASSNSTFSAYPFDLGTSLWSWLALQAAIRQNALLLFQEILMCFPVSGETLAVWAEGDLLVVLL